MLFKDLQVIFSSSLVLIISMVTEITSGGVVETLKMYSEVERSMQKGREEGREGGREKGILQQLLNHVKLIIPGSTFLVLLPRQLPSKVL